eukprot:3623996-Prymnesium_polylepis.1
MSALPSHILLATTDHVTNRNYSKEKRFDNNRSDHNAPSGEFSTQWRLHRTASAPSFPGVRDVPRPPSPKVAAMSATAFRRPESPAAAFRRTAAGAGGTSPLLFAPWQRPPAGVTNEREAASERPGLSSAKCTTAGVGERALRLSDRE